MPKSTNAHITKSTTPEAEALVRVEGVSKKFCKDLKRSLWYGIQDITSELFGLKKKEGLRKDEFWAVSDVSFELKRGECLGLIGHNGAGKSTLLKILNGLIKPDKGKITMKGRIAALIELGAGFNPILTGRENVFNNGAVLGFTQKEIAAKYQDIVEFAELEEFMDTPVQNYSSGMKVRLGFAVAAQMEPDVLIIDEVLAVGDVGFRSKCMNKINDLLKISAVIFVSHSMPLVNRTVSSLIFMVNGEEKYSGSNLHLGIELYLKLFKNEGLRVVGSGKARIIEAKFIESNYIFEHFSNIRISLNVDIKESVEIFNVVILILSRDMIQVASIYSRFDHKPFLGSVQKINVTFKNQLNSGEYTINIGIVESKKNDSYKPGEVYCMYENILKLSSISANVFSHIPIRIEGNWD